MRAIVLGVALQLVVGSVSAQAFPAPPSAQGIQLADGTKVFRVSFKEPKGADAELRIADYIGSGLGTIRWCENGWEETKRTPTTMGIILVEGKCK